MSQYKNKSELEFEREVIEFLTNIGGVKQWEYRQDINNDEKLWANFKEILERNNAGRLDGPLSVTEFNQVKSVINNIQTPYQAGQFLYGVNGVSEIEVDLDNGRHVFLTIFDQSKIGCGNTAYQIVNQVSRPKIENTAKGVRFDITLLINGLPIIQIELKKALHSTKESLNQMKQYISEKQYSGIFSTLQILVAMTPYDIKYMANTTIEGFNEAFAFNWQEEDTALPVRNWKSFANKFLSIPMAHDMSTRFMILDGTKNKECIKVMRPYQVYATMKVMDAIRNYDFKYNDNRLGYIWHTTGSGKTITSFKTAWLASRLPNVDKVVFLVDRVALTNQTADAYKAYDPIAGFEGKTGVISDTANVSDLQKKLSQRSDKNIIVTSIQKMYRFVSRENLDKFNQKILFIVDEAHRSTGDGRSSEGMLETIRKAIPKAGWVGYTGTPKFPETSDIFGEPLHIYTIKEAIADRNVLGFKVDFKETIKAPENPDEDDFDDNIKASVYDTSEEHINLVVEDILENWKERSANYKYNAMLTVHVGGNKASTPRAMEYYQKFKEKMKDLPEEQKLKVGLSFSLDTSNGDNQYLNNKALKEAMDDYNKMFGTNHGTDNVKQYSEDVIRRLNKTADDKQYLDLVIVVDQLLTGFDAPQLNTLYIDRTLRGSGLIQAYSRTNRLHNRETKPFGNVINYRWPEQNEYEMNKAFAIYSNRASADKQMTIKELKEVNKKDGIIAVGFSEVEYEMKEVVKKLSSLTEGFKNTPPSESDQDELYNELKKYNALLNKLKQYTTDDEGNKVSAYANPEEFYSRIGITEDEEIMLTTVIFDELRDLKAKRENIDISQISLELIHVHDVTINYDYLVELIAKMADEVHADNMEAARGYVTAINSEISKSDNDNEKAKIRSFVDKVIKKEFEFDSYPAPRNVDEMNQAIDKSYRDGNLELIRNFIKRWGLDNSTKLSEIEALIANHQIGQEDMDKQGEFTRIMNSAKEDYKQIADEDVIGLSWVKYRTSLRSAFMTLADTIKKGE